MKSDSAAAGTPARQTKWACLGCAQVYEGEKPPAFSFQHQHSWVAEPTPARQTKGPSIPKKVRRVLSADESLQRYFHHLQKHLDERMSQRWKLARIVQRRDDNVQVVMQISKIHETPEGVYIEVR